MGPDTRCSEVTDESLYETPVNDRHAGSINHASPMRAPATLSHLSLHPQAPPDIFFPFLGTAHCHGAMLPRGKEHHCWACWITWGWGEGKEGSDTSRSALYFKVDRAYAENCSPFRAENERFSSFAGRHMWIWTGLQPQCEKPWCHLSLGYLVSPWPGLPWRQSPSTDGCCEKHSCVQNTSKLWNLRGRQSSVSLTSLGNSNLSSQKMSWRNLRETMATRPIQYLSINSLTAPMLQDGWRLSSF